jgi:lysophospholipase L1-like esterase
MGLLLRRIGFVRRPVIARTLLASAIAIGAAVLAVGIARAEDAVSAANPAPAIVQGQSNVAAATPAVSQQKGIAGQAADRVEALTRSIADVFRRVPCAGPKSGTYLEGSLPHIGKKLAASQPVTIVAFGSSSTVGFGVSSPAFTYPNRLADLLRRKFPKADITVLNRGVGGEDTPEMMRRLQAAVLDARPDLVIWQFGTNAVIRGDNPALTEQLVTEGIEKMRAAGADVVMIDPQYVPAIASKPDSANRMVALMKRIAHLEHVGLFPRFAVMKSWYDTQSASYANFTYQDGLHMNDWGYACFAQLLGDTIIDSVARVQAGIEAPQDVLMFRPM